MAPPTFPSNLGISRDETSGKNFERLDVIDPNDDSQQPDSRGQSPIPTRDHRQAVSDTSRDTSDSESVDSDESDHRRRSHTSKHFTLPRHQVEISRAYGRRSPSRRIRHHSREARPRVNSPSPSKRQPTVTEDPGPDADSEQDESGYKTNRMRDILVVHDRHGDSSSDDTSDPSTLREEIRRLRRENKRMRDIQDNGGFATRPAQIATTYKTFYQIGPKYFLQEPHWEPGEGASTVLACENGIRSFSDYVDQHPDIAFTVIKVYDPRPPMDRSKIETKDGAFLTPEPMSQFLLFISDPAIRAVEDFVDQVPQFRELFPQFNPRRNIKAPYLFMFHCAPYFQEIVAKMDATGKYLMVQVEKCIRESHGFEHDSAKALAKKGRVSNDLFGYLIQPGDVLVKRAGPRTEGFIALDWATEAGAHEQEPEDDLASEWDYREGGFRGWDAHKKKEPQTWYSWTVPVWSWGFDGNFQMQRRNLMVGLEASYSGEIIPIDKLKIIPLKYASTSIRSQLEKRGRMFWTLRKGRFVNYRQTEAEDLSKVGTLISTFRWVSGLRVFKVEGRHMVDVETYKKLHPNSTMNGLRLRSSISSKNMKSNEPPSGNDLLVFPNRIPGFNLLRKMWGKLSHTLTSNSILLTFLSVDLFVDYVSEIVWNKQAFEDLVANDETKELVHALVMKQIAAEQSTDFIAGKGNGLIVLLHGGPGTGKTFTAESVAEIAEKPLLRVTCGDIGTTAETVEKKLQSSFYLGKIWDCVVLLDEADVFLEERDMKDLNRNALVSVFLRELEYHDGILILTSNRVGTFDEAFKSRIQLSLHYENLGVSQRRKIWRNFMRRIKSLDSTVNFDDIVDNIDELSSVELNGREIRNAITTARQLAQFKNQPLSYSHLDHVLRVSRQFGRYLKDLRDGLTDDDVKREGGLRLSYKNSSNRPENSLF
ncbi:unnamed protein product [Clonostachys solani]|uniref:AAA+ ATPase domain-containing protein n=1 Tax=Clonostachys solani TaxID=160281 RepID=A0A9P0EJQ8_9HYPO|nr:unnamed protein product [Clonostachys solani]